MSTRDFQVYGNLALAAEPAYVESSPRFTVIEGRGARAERPAVSGRHVSRAAVAIAATVVALLFFAVALVGWSTYAGRAEAHADTLSHISFEEVRVQAGDSLWSLASSILSTISPRRKPQMLSRRPMNSRGLFSRRERRFSSPSLGRTSSS